MPDLRGFRVIVPVKRFAEAKSRMDIEAPAGTPRRSGHPATPTTLAAGTTGAEACLRGAMGPLLAEAMLEDTFALLAEARFVETIELVTSEPAAASMAREQGLTCVPDPGRGLNEALRAAITNDQTCGPSRRTVVVPTDLVALTPAALDALLGTVAHARWFVPDADGMGTALLGLPGRPDTGTILTHFGAGSAGRHRAAGFVPVAWPPGADLTDADTLTDLHGRRLGPALTRALAELGDRQAGEGPALLRHAPTRQAPFVQAPFGQAGVHRNPVPG